MIEYSLHTNIDPKQEVHSVAFSPDGQFLAAGVDDGVRIYHLSSCRLFLRIYTLSTVLCLHWDVRGDLFGGCQSGYLALISIDLLLQTVEVVFSQVSQSPVKSIVVHPAGTYMAMAEKQLISIWRRRRKPQTSTLTFPWVFVKELEGPKANDCDEESSDTLSSISWMDGKKYVLASSYGSQGIRVWNVHDQDPIFSVPVRVFEGSLSPCGRYFANSNGRSVKIFEMETCVEVKTLTPKGSLLSSTPVIWVHGGGFVLNARHGRADLWHVSSKQCCSLTLEGESSQKLVTHLASFMGINDRVRSFQIALVSGRSQISIWTAEQRVPGISAPRRRTPAIIVVISTIGVIGAVFYYLFTMIS